MNIYLTKLPKFFTTTLLSSTILFSAMLIPSLAQAEEVAEVITESAGWDSTNVEKLVAHTGREVVHHLIAAAASLDKSSGKARGNLVAAHRLNYSALQMMPFLSVTEDVFNAKGKLAMGETDRFYDELLPIYSQLDTLALYAPEAATKAIGHLKKAERLARKGNSKVAMDSLTDLMDIVSKTTVYMPVLYVEGQIKAALYGLNQPKRDITLAKRAITNALNSLSAFTEEVVVKPSATK
jgi:hypothetical protein